MSLLAFQEKIHSIKGFVDKLHRENVPLPIKELLLRTYARDLNIHLTDQMIGELFLL